jgi:hypothetical protein
LKNRILIVLIVVLTTNSCGIFKTHHKNKLINFENNPIPKNTLKLNGYYFAELERDAIKGYDKVEGTKIKYLSVFFIYDDGFMVNISGIEAIATYSCAKKEAYENTYESAHRTIELLLDSQNSEIKRTKRMCGFKPNDIGNKGLVKVNDGRIKIQFYSIEMQNPNKDSFNSAYLNELNGTIKSDSSFVIKNETEFRANETTTKNTLFRFKQTKQKPNVENYFKKNKNRFK